MWDVLKAAFLGIGAMTIAFFTMMFLLRGCVALVGADEPIRPATEPQGVYKAHDVYGRPYIDRDLDALTFSDLLLLQQDDEVIVIIPEEPSSTLSAYECVQRQEFYESLKVRYAARTDTPPGFWDSTLNKYKVLLKDCQ